MRQFVLAIFLNYIHCIYYNDVPGIQILITNSLRLIFPDYYLILFDILIILHRIKVT